LEQISAVEENQRLLAVLEAAQRLRASMPALERDIVSDLHHLQQERDHELPRGD
jgi:phosphoketolase